MMTQYLQGKLISHRLFYTRDGKHAAPVETVTVSRGRDYYYCFTPNAEAGAEYRNYHWSFEEVEIIKGIDGMYTVNFYGHSSIYVRSDLPFVSMEVEKEELIHWNEFDIWFQKEIHMRVSRSGKRTHGAKRGVNGYSEERCDICGYPAKNNECGRCSIAIKKLDNGREKSPFLVAAVNHYVAKGAVIHDGNVIWPIGWEPGMLPLTKIKGVNA